MASPPPGLKIAGPAVVLPNEYEYDLIFLPGGMMTAPISQRFASTSGSAVRVPFTRFQTPDAKAWGPWIMGAEAEENAKTTDSTIKHETMVMTVAADGQIDCTCNMMVCDHLEKINDESELTGIFGLLTQGVEARHVRTELASDAMGVLSLHVILVRQGLLADPPYQQDQFYEVYLVAPEGSGIPDLDSTYLGTIDTELEDFHALDNLMADFFEQYIGNVRCKQSLHKNTGKPFEMQTLEAVACLFITGRCPACLARAGASSDDTSDLVPGPDEGSYPHRAESNGPYKPSAADIETARRDTALPF